MHRRDFLVSSTLASAGSALPAAAAAVGAGMTPADAQPRAGKHTTLTMAVGAAIASPNVMDTAKRLARRIEAAFDDRFQVAVLTAVETGIEAVTTGLADLYIGHESQHAGYHPAFHLIAGQPLGEALAPAAQQAWLSIGSGSELWSELSRAHDVVAFQVAHTGSSPGLYSERLIEHARDFAGARVACRGLARNVMAHLGATVVDVPDVELRGSLGGAAIDAAEPLIAPLSAVAHWAYSPGLMPAGLTLTLGMRASFFERLGRSGQAIIAGLAAEAYALSRADIMGREAAIRQVGQYRRWPVTTMMPAPLQTSLEAASAAVLDEIRDHDVLAARMVDSLRAFRRVMEPERSLPFPAFDSAALS